MFAFLLAVRTGDEDHEEICDVQDVLKRKLCTECCCTYTSANCLRCEQNAAYNASVSADSMFFNVAEPTSPIATSPICISSTATSPESVVRPSIQELRSLRVCSLSNLNTQSFQQLPGESSSVAECLPEVKSIEESSIEFLSSSDSVTLHIKRRSVYKDVMKKFNLHFAKKHLRRVNVTFITGCTDKNQESGVDDGGLGRELISSMYEECRGKLLQGPLGHFTFVHDVVKLQNKEFENFGKFVAHEYFGYTKYTPRFRDKEEFIRTMAHHQQISMYMEEIQAFMKGLSSNGVLESMKTNVQGSIKLLTYSDSLICASGIIGLLKPIYSAEVRRQEKKEVIFANFVQLIEEVGTEEDRNAISLSYLDDIESGYHAPTIHSRIISLSDLLMFLTGMRYLTHAEQYEVRFDHSEEGKRVVRRLEANTCNNVLVLPVNQRYLDEDCFSQNVICDVLNSPGFGMV